MSELQDGIRILKAEITNFKNISHKEINIGGKSMIIAGKNGAGKSSIIQALTSPLDARYTPVEPVKQGEEKGELQVTIGGILNDELVNYTVCVRYVEGSNKGKLVILDQDGAKINGGRGLIDSIVGNIGFDIFDFLNKGLTPQGKVSEKGVREQIEILRDLLPQEGKVRLNKLDREHEEVYNERTQVNSEAKMYRSKANTELTDEEIELYSEMKDDTEVKEKMSKIGEEIENWNEKFGAHGRAKSFLVTADENLEKIEAKIKELQEMKEDFLTKIESAKKTRDELDKFLKENPNKPSMESLTEELDKIHAHNDIVKGVQEILHYTTKAEELEAESEKKTARLTEIKAERKGVFNDYPLPVKYLEFDDDKITFKGLPLHEEQIPTSTLITIGARIGMAMNPNLRVMIVKDGSLLDNKTTNNLLKFCEKKGYQLLIERVDSDLDNAEITFVEKEG